MRIESINQVELLYPFLAIELKERDLALLLKIQSFFGVGTIQHIKTKGHVLYVVNSVKHLHRVIIPHFSNYHLLTEKIISFLLFKDVISLMINKEHLTTKGLKEIMSIRCCMNKGISPELLRSFTSAMGAIIPAVRPVLSPVEPSQISTG